MSYTASQLIEFLYCPRFTYFEYVLDIPQKEDNKFKVQKGRSIHEKIRKMNPGYLRKKLEVVDKQSDCYLSSGIGIRGIVDEILFKSDGTASPLDYKYAEYKNRIFETYRYQLVFYGKLIKDNFDVPVTKGYIVYTRSKNKLIEVSISKKDFARLENDIENISTIINWGKYPKPTKYKKRCDDCCYKNICER